MELERRRLEPGAPEDSFADANGGGVLGDAQLGLERQTRAILSIIASTYRSMMATRHARSHGFTLAASHGGSCALAPSPQQTDRQEPCNAGSMDSSPSDVPFADARAGLMYVVSGFRRVFRRWQYARHSLFTKTPESTKLTEMKGMIR